MMSKDNDIVVRKVRLDDDFDRIAELIYKTDDYIYPWWFHDSVEECKKVMVPLMKEEGFFYNYKNMYVAVDKNTNEIVGLINLVTPNTNLDYDYTNLRKIDEDRYAYTIDKYVMELINEVKELNIPYFSNVAVASEYEGKKIGTMMMQYVIEDKKKEYLKFILDVISNNPSAKKVYKRVGFDTTSYNPYGMGYGPNDIISEERMELNVFRRK